MPISNINDLSLHRVVGRGGAAPAAGWTYDRPSEWPAIAADIGVSDQKMVGLFQVDDSSAEFCSITCTTTSGTYSVDWGDGTSDTGIASGTRADHQYTYSDVDLTTTTYGYKVAKVTVTTSVTSAMQNIDFTSKNSTNEPNSTIIRKWLDIDIRFPTLTALTVSGNAVRNRLLKFRLRASAITSADYDFYEAHSLQWVEEFNSTALTVTSNMFYNCYGLVKAPAGMDFSAVTTTTQMFYNCFALIEIPTTINLAVCTDTSSMFYTCYSLRSISNLTFNTTTNWNGSNMFYFCTALLEIPSALSFEKCSNANGMFNNCYAIKEVPATINLAVCTNTGNMFNTCYSLTVVPTSINMPSATNTALMFSNCRELRKAPALNLASSTSTNSIFQNCFNLETFSFSNQTGSNGSLSTLFNGCTQISKIENVIFTGNTAAATFTNLYNLSSLTGCTFPAGQGINVTNTRLNAAALDALYTSLPTASGTTAQKTVTITGTYGAASDTPTIATAKGWIVTG